MPGFELIGSEEQEEVNDLFNRSRILFRHSFDQLRNGVYKVRDFETAFAKYMGCEDALAVTSGSAALRVALAALGIGQGDEVITQSFTFVATVEAIIESGAQPVITEVNETLNMDYRDLQKKITPKTKAIIVVHMLGIPADMGKIVPVARMHNLPIIEDSAWGCGAKLNGQYLGTIGDAGTYSFDFAKTMTTGEGGMVVCRNKEALMKAKAYHDHGHENNPALPRWEDSRSGSGFNYRMTELQGAVGLAQLKKLGTVIEMQRKNKGRLLEELRDFKSIQFRKRPNATEETADALVFFVDSNATARACREALLKQRAGTKILPEAITWHYAGTWNHMPALVSRYPNLAEAFPESKRILDKAVALPIFAKMDDDFPLRVHRALKEVLG
ncbi:MAG: DegT/DnrJ/EryC1/StrS family aminotransferase [Bacteroidota bacterium]|jgi:8-amino-3,8-dideoxy-alpha-D-manno-octulosonate transaminase